ncbi:hypothetical protein DFJ58DRAFT_660020, partial [Suillus subalutaceus]|uniref:uncharacterized protein n=1 Tax=Suillus subalutaceus TaxID=48586 RepID=UPI001B872356
SQSDATVRRLNQALSTLHKKSDEIQALQAALALEREKTSKLEAEVKVAWQSPSTTTQEGIASSAQPQQTASARERALWDVHREAMELQRTKWEADHTEWVRDKELWETEREKWSAERTSMIEAHEALVADVTRSKSSLDALTRSKSLAEKDRDFFRDQYTQASGFVSATRAENVELEQKAKTAEGQARDGVALIKHMFESQIKALKEDVDRWRGVSTLLQEKDRRTDDLIRRRAAEHPELAERCRQLERQVNLLRADLIELGRVHQKSSAERDKMQDLKLSELQEHNQMPDFHLVKLSYTELEPGEIIELNGLSGPDTSFLGQADALEVDVSPEEAEEEECGLYPCKWKTGPDVIDQCQQSFDCREVGSALRLNQVGAQRQYRIWIGTCMISIIAVNWERLSNVSDLISYCKGYLHPDLYERSQHMIVFGVRANHDDTSRDFSLRPRSGST